MRLQAQAKGIPQPCKIWRAFSCSHLLQEEHRQYYIKMKTHPIKLSECKGHTTWKDHKRRELGASTSSFFLFFFCCNLFYFNASLQKKMFPFALEPLKEADAILFALFHIEGWCKMLWILMELHHVAQLTRKEGRRSRSQKEDEKWNDHYYHI